MSSIVTRVALLSLILLAVSGLPALAQQSAGGASLAVTPSARADGMGRAFVSIADDPSAVWWNPAGLAFMHDKQVMTNYAKLVPDLADDVFHLYFAYINGGSSWGTFGGSLVYLSYGQNTITKPDQSGNGSDSVGVFNSYELSPSLSFGTALSHNVGVGFTVKLLYVNLAPTFALEQTIGLGAGGEQLKGTGSAVAVDFGMLGRDTVSVHGKQVEMAVGAMVQNLGPSISFVDQANADPLPRNLHLGVSSRVILQKGYEASIAGNLQQSLVSSKDRGVWHVGGELLMAGTLAGRVGYISDPDGAIKDATFGLGVIINNLEIDFASVPQATTLDRVKKFALQAHF